MTPMATDIQVLTLAQLSGGQDWQVQLAHDRSHHLLVWITRGQGRALLDGLRRGIGAHNALWVPAGALFSMDMGRQSMGQAVLIPQGTPLRLPEMPRHLRIRDVTTQSELTALIEAAQREQSQQRPLRQDALEAHTALISVWLRRQIMQDEHVPDRRNAAGRLSQRYCNLLSAGYQTGASMAAYADELGVTSTHLTRAVKSATGKTAADLLTERVLHAGRSLLGETAQPAKDIARHLGFGSAAYFTRFIQHHTGLPPSKLRQGTL